MYGDKRFLFDIVANGRNGIDVDKYVTCWLLSRLLTPWCIDFISVLWKFIHFSLYTCFLFRFDYIERDTRACGLGRNFDYHRLVPYRRFLMYFPSVRLLVIVLFLAHAMYYLVNTVLFDIPNLPRDQTFSPILEFLELLIFYKWATAATTLKQYTTSTVDTWNWFQVGWEHEGHRRWNLF